MLGAFAFPCLAQQPFKTFPDPQKIKESEIPDHSVTHDSSYKYFGRWINDSVGHLFSKNLRTGDTISLTKGLGYYGKVIMSPSGRQLVYEWIIDDKFTEIRTVGIDGSDPRILYSDSVLFSLLQDWSPDGKYVSAMVFNKERTFQTLLIQVSNDSIKVLRRQQFKSLNWGFQQCKMSFSEDSKFIGYDISTNNSWYNRDIFIRPVAGGEEIPIAQNPANDLLIGWTPDNQNILFASDRSGRWDLWTIQVLNGKAHGTPKIVKENIGAPITVLDFTKEGVLYYKMGVHDNFNVSVATLDTTIKKIKGTKILSSHIGFNTAVQWSHDGNSLAYAFGIGSGYEPLTLAIRSYKNGNEQLIKLKDLMRHGGHGFEPQWSPDGKHIIATARQRDYYGPGMDSQGLYEIDVITGKYMPVKISSTICGLDCYWAPLWLTNGRLIFECRLTATLFIKDLETGIEKEIYHQPDTAIIRKWPASCLAVSPDGKEIAFIWAHRIGELWINKLMMLSVSGGEPEELYTTSNGQQLSVPAWMPDSHNIIFTLSKDAGNTSFELITINTDTKKSEKLGLKIDGMVPYSFSVHPNGKQIAYTTGKEIYYREETWVLSNFLPGTNIK